MVKACMTKDIPHAQSTLQTEAIAIKDGLQLGLPQGYDAVIIESDFSTCMSKLLFSSTDLSETGSLLVMFNFC